MARDDDDDLYDEEFDFVDDDDDDEVGDEDDEARDEREERDEPDNRDDRDQKKGKHRSDDLGGEERGREQFGREEGEGEHEGQAEDEEPVDEYGRPEPKADYVVHVYEHKKFKRTIERPFTAEEAEAFATEFNRTSKLYGRMAVVGKNEAKPKKALD